jgi:predicted methyltransferase
LAALAVAVSFGCRPEPPISESSAAASRSRAAEGATENDSGDRTPAHLTLALAAPTRADEERDRDPWRKPDRVLAFWGLEPGDRVVDLMAGRGFYTEILAHAVGKSGRVWAHNSPFVMNRFASEPLCRRLGKPGLEHVEILVSELDEPGLPADLDMAVMVLFYHDTYWQGVDRAAMNRALFDALRPGGVFGLIDHRAEPGSGDRDVLSLHRVDSDLVMAEVLAAGFEWDGESSLLAHPEDTLDYNVFRDVRTRRDRTDRFVFRFRKPER